MRHRMALWTACMCHLLMLRNGCANTIVPHLNKIRRAHHVRDVVWDHDLALEAKELANTILEKQGDVIVPAKGVNVALKWVGGGGDVADIELLRHAVDVWAMPPYTGAQDLGRMTLNDTESVGAGVARRNGFAAMCMMFGSAHDRESTNKAIAPMTTYSDTLGPFILLVLLSMFCMHLVAILATF